MLRRYAWPGYIEAEPDAPVREVDVLTFAAGRGLPVPTVVAADTTGGSIGDGVPSVLMSYMRGRAVGAPDLRSLAEVAAAIHATDPAGIGHEYFPWYEAEMLTPPPRSRRPCLWETAIELWQSAMPDYEPAFIHRDFHPGNVLWWRGRLSGVVDWPNGCRGPVGCDLAHCRANLRALAGPDAADRFVAAYEALTGRSLHPFWVMAGHLEHSHRHWTTERLAEAEPDLAAAVAAITA